LTLFPAMNALLQTALGELSWLDFDNISALGLGKS
jgi:hypothetical protein